MRTIQFIPLRRIKKTGKATVSNYLQWNKVSSSDSLPFELTLRGHFKEFDLKERVYNHKGELLFWYNHKDFDSLPKWKPSPEMMDFIQEEFDGELWKLHKIEDMPERLDPSVMGFDCNSTPVFSHYTQDYIGIHCAEVKDFEILTVETVLKWYGWFIYNLKNAQIKYE